RMPINPLFGIELWDLPEELVAKDRLKIERASSGDRDASGNPITTYVTVYKDLRACVASLSAQDRMQFMQQGLDVTHFVYFPPMLAGYMSGGIGFVTPGELPDIRGRDRFQYGTRRDGALRILSMMDVHDEQEAGVLLVAKATERIMGI